MNTSETIPDLIPAWINGKLQPYDKLAVHQRGLRHKAVSIFVLNAGRILLQQRAMTKYHTPGLWANTCCTHPNWEEEPSDCANRRLQEELGMTNVTPVFRDQIEYSADVGQGMIENEVVDIFVVNVADEPTITLNPTEVMAVRWVGMDTLKNQITHNPDIFTPWLRIYIAQHADTIFRGL